MWCKEFITHIILTALEGLWQLGSLFYQGTQYLQRGIYVTNLLLCDIPWNKAPRTGPCYVWHAVPFLWPREEHRRQRSWVDNFASQCLLCLLSSRKTFFCPHTWSSNQSGGGAILALSNFLNQIPHQKEPEISVGILSSRPLLTTTMVCLI